jgi:branched-chain amino acid transport system ATP-binding protein
VTATSREQHAAAITTARLEVRDVSVRFGGLTALAGVSLRLQPAEIVGLIGPNGAGKTTLLDVISGRLRPDTGSVHLDGRRLDRRPPSRRARLGLARTFQDGRLFPGLTLTENLEVARYSKGHAGLASALVAGPAVRADRRQATAHAEEILAAVGLAGYADMAASALPLGIQRVAEVARALCLEPRVLLLDEPTAGLGGQETDALRRLLAGVPDRHGVSIVVVAHDLRFVLTFADRVYVLHQGATLAEGSPDEIRTDPTVARIYVGNPHATG